MIKGHLDNRICVQGAQGYGLVSCVLDKQRFPARAHSVEEESGTYLVEGLFVELHDPDFLLPGGSNNLNVG